MCETPFYQHDGITLFCADALDLLATLDDGSVSLIATDPPYYRVKSEDWDRQWETADDYLAWIDDLCVEFQRVLKANGSLYLFASPQMAARVEVKVREHFNVLNQIVWVKSSSGTEDGGQWKKVSKKALRSYFPRTERIIFAEHYGADNCAKGEVGYARACDDLHRFVFESLRAYLAGEWKRAGLKFEQANEACGTVSMAARHFFSRSQWCLPTRGHYESLQRYANHNSPGEYLRADYEELRADYEELRRPFYARPDAPYTDVWTFPTVQGYVGKHVCEKPLALMTHIVEMSSRADTLVLDPFCGSGATLIAARNLRRRAIGGDVSQRWCQRTAQRLARTMGEYQTMSVESETLEELPLFASGANAASPTPPPC